MAEPFDNVPLPMLAPLGDSGLLVRFADALTDGANRAAVAFARRAQALDLPGVLEVVPNVVSVLLRYDPLQTSFAALAGEVRLALSREGVDEPLADEWTIPVRFDGPDLAEVAALLDTTVPDFIAAHTSTPLRVLATGFAPGFVYCGLHGPELVVPRRGAVRPEVPAGSVLFAAGQTAIAATAMPTGWHVIGSTTFRNFDATAQPPTRLAAGGTIRFVVAP